MFCHQLKCQAQAHVPRPLTNGRFQAKNEFVMCVMPIQVVCVLIRLAKSHAKRFSQFLACGALPVSDTCEWCAASFRHV
jgi:hypothetical protein